MGDDGSGTGTAATDQGSGGNDGTLTNSPTFAKSHLFLRHIATPTA